MTRVGVSRQVVARLEHQTMRRHTHVQNLISKLRNVRPGRLVRNALALIVSSTGTSILGVFFWGVATHLTTASSVGRSSAEITAMIFLASLAQLSFNSIFERFLPVAGPKSRSFVGRAYAISISVALLIASTYAMLGWGRRFVPRGFWWQALFVFAVILWTLFVLQDSVLIGIRQAKWVPVENIAFALLKLALLPMALAFSRSQGIFMAWTAPVAPAVGWVTLYLFRRGILRHEKLTLQSDELPSPRELIKLAGAQYMTLLFWAFSPSIITLIVIQRLGAVSNAHYYVPALIESGLYLILLSIGRSFLVEAAHEPEALRRHSRTATRAMLLILIPSVAIGVAFAPIFLRIFGSGYAQSGTTLLRLLLLSLLGSSAMIFYSTFAWLDKKVWQMTSRSFATMVLNFGVIFWLIDREGILAIGIAGLASSLLQVVLFVPISIRRYRRAP